MTQNDTTMLTAEFCHRNNIKFYPKTVDEALFIQKRLADFGIRWVDNSAVGANVSECTSLGMAVQNGKLYYNPSSSTAYITCTSEQLDRNYVPPERAFLIEQFNKMADTINTLAARVESLEKKISDMHGAVFPAVEDTKPKLKRAP